MLNNKFVFPTTNRSNEYGCQNRPIFITDRKALCLELSHSRWKKKIRIAAPLRGGSFVGFLRAGGRAGGQCPAAAVALREEHHVLRQQDGNERPPTHLPNNHTNPPYQPISALSTDIVSQLTHLRCLSFFCFVLVTFIL